MTVPETSEKRRFVRPADYYSSATPPPVLPRGVAYGCGGAAVLALMVIFAGGALLTGSRLMQFMDMALGMSLGEMRGQFAADVTPERRKSLDAEIETMRQNLRNEKISVADLQPFLQGLQSAINDRRVTAQEATQLENTVRKINASAAR